MVFKRPINLCLILFEEKQVTYLFSEQTLLFFVSGTRLFSSHYHLFFLYVEMKLGPICVPLISAGLTLFLLTNFIQILFE